MVRDAALADQIKSSLLCVLEDILGPGVPGCCLNCMARTRWESCEEYCSGGPGMNYVVETLFPSSIHSVLYSRTLSLLSACHWACSAEKLVILAGSQTSPSEA